MPGSEEEIIGCYACHAPMNVAEVAPYSRVICPGCKTENRVKKQFGPYTLTRRHAIGGMSSVFVGRDEALDREVALKILSEEYSKDEKRIAAFEDEARLTASFSHPNVVRVLTTGRAFGRFYIAMEFVPGGHFEHRIREAGQVSETEILPLAIQVAEGLKGAQAAGLIHRDVKPGNILLDSEGNAKIVDFGLALVTNQGKAKATEIWATPYYVPPEAIEGGTEDFRADVYAFGATLYHALAGTPPCNEESMATAVLREAKRKIIPLKKVAPHLLDETCAVIDRAMAYHPDKRFSSYDEMIGGLQAALKLANGAAASDATGESSAQRRAGIRAGKRRTQLIIGSAALLALVGATILVVSNRDEPIPPPPVVSKVVSIDPDSQGEVGGQTETAAKYRSAREAMAAGDFSAANVAFSELLSDEGVQEPTRTWAGLEAVASALMDGRMSRAKKNSAAVASHINSAPEGLDPAFANALSPVLAAFSGFALIQPDTAENAIQSEARFMGLFLAGLNNWEKGGLAQAVPFFKKVADESSASQDGLFSWYRQTADRYLSDFQLLTAATPDADPTSPKDCREAIGDLNRTLTLLKTKGRARFNVRARQLEYARLEKSLKKAAREIAIPEPAVDVAGEVGSLAREYRFPEIVEKVSKLKGDKPGINKEALLGMAQAALVFLSEMEADLTKKSADIELTTKDGTAITSIGMSPEGRLVGKMGSGEIIELDWTDFPTAELIDLHRELVKEPASAMERLRRHESAIAFEWLAGDRDRAMAAAARLAAESESFKERWELISGGLPE